MRTLAVTGARGRVGKEVVRRLTERGDRVVALDRVAPAAPDNPLTQPVLSDLDNPASLASTLEGTDAVVHLAAFMSWSDDDSEPLFQANVTGTFVVLEAMRMASVSRIIFASSGEVYPEGAPLRLPIDESHPRSPRSHYGMNKLLGEEMCAFYERRYGYATTVVRLPHTQDATELLDEDSPFSGPRFFLHRKIEQQERFGNHEAVRRLREVLVEGEERLLLSRGDDGTPYSMPICDTRDTAAGVVSALDNERAIGEAIGLAPPTAARFDELVPLMSQRSNIPYVDVRLPGPAVSYVVDTRKAREILGFRPEHSLTSMIDEAVSARKSRPVGR